MSAVASQPRQRLQVWWQALRPKSFTATTTPVLIGIAVALLDGRFAPLWAALTLVGVCALQGGTNLLNDWFDHRTGADDVAYRQGDAVRQQALTPGALLAGGLTCFAVGALSGAAAALHAGPLVWWMLAVGVVIGLTYTTGPFPLAYLGLGELAVFVAMGPGIVVGSYAVQAGAGSLRAVLAGVPIGLLVTAVIQANNLRDLEQDRSIGKLTLAARFGRTFARREYLLLVYGAYAALAVLACVDPWLGLAGLPALITLPQAVRLVRQACTSEEPAALNGVLRGSALLHGRFGLYWTAGLLAAAAVRFALG